jgi:opacity protein-like surface antigen
MSRFYTLCSAVLFVLFLVPTAGQAETGKNYFLLGTGLQTRDNGSDSGGEVSFDTGFSLNGAVGYRLTRHFRAEFEGAYFSNEADTHTLNPAFGGTGEKDADGRIDATALLINLYVDFPIENSRFTPYVGIGAGKYKVAVRGLTSDDIRSGPLGAITADSSWTTAWQVRAGTDIALNPQTNLVLGYRYLYGEDMDLVDPMGNVLDPNLRLHNLELGIRYKF